MSQIITGLDIGTTSIKGVVAEQDKEGNISILNTFKRPSSGFRKGILVDGDEACKVFRDVIIDLENVSKKAAHNIFINVNGKYIKSRTSQGIIAVSRADQEIQHEDVDRVNQASEAIKLPGNYVILHNITSEYFVDDVGDIQDPVGMTGSRLEVETLIVEAFNPHISRVVRAIKKAGGDVTGVVFTPLASARGVLSKRQKELGTLLVDMGSETTSFVVYEEGKVLYTKSLPIGSSHVTNDIAIGLKIDVEIAEKLKSMYGYALSKEVSRRDKVKLSDLDPSYSDDDTEISKRFLAEIIEIRLEEIFDLIDNELKNIGREIQLPAGVVLCGGGVKIPGIEDLAKDQLKLSTQIGYPEVENLNILNPTHKELAEDPEFATAVGLLRWADEETRISGSESFFSKILKSLTP